MKFREHFEGSYAQISFLPVDKTVDRDAGLK
jgi:hypothetical protein